MKFNKLIRKNKAETKKLKKEIAVLENEMMLPIEISGNVLTYNNKEYLIEHKSLKDVLGH